MEYYGDFLDKRLRFRESGFVYYVNVFVYGGVGIRSGVVRDDFRVCIF